MAPCQVQQFPELMVFLAQGVRVTLEHLFCADSVQGKPLSSNLISSGMGIQQ